MSQEIINEELKCEIIKNLDVCMSLDCTGPFSRTRRGLQHMMGKKYSDTNKSAEYESIMNYAVRSEMSCPGSGLIFLKLLTGVYEEIDNSVVRNKSDIIDILKCRYFDDKVLQLLKQSLEYMNNVTRLSIKKSSNQNNHIEIVEGFNFKVKNLLKDSNHTIELIDAKVLCIDGFIESVSEVHHLFSFIAEKQDTCLIFSRGMSEDVLHTIKVNNDRKTFYTLPFVIPFDPENVNTIVDIAVVSGTDVVSSTKGNLISSIDLQTLGKIDSCVLSLENLRIKNSSTKNAVKTHRVSLKNLLEDRPELEHIISSRLRCLSSSCIDFCIPDDINFYSTSQQLDEGIRIISSIVNNTYSPSSAAKSFLNSYYKTFETTKVFTLE